MIVWFIVWFVWSCVQRVPARELQVHGWLARVDRSQPHVCRLLRMPYALTPTVHLFRLLALPHPLPLRPLPRPQILKIQCDLEDVKQVMAKNIDLVRKPGNHTFWAGVASRLGATFRARRAFYDVYV